MRRFINEWWDTIVFSTMIYLILSILLWGARAESKDSCEPKYMDYVFPITFLHCKR